MPLDIGSIQVIEGNTVVQVVTPTEAGPAGPPGPQGPAGMSYDPPYENVAGTAIVTYSPNTTISGNGPTARGFNDYWETTNQGAWINLNLGQAYNIAYVVFGTRIVSDLSQAPMDYAIDYSTDDINYFNIITATNNTDTLQNIFANGVLAQYIRITVNTLQPLSASAKIAGLLVFMQNCPAFAGDRPWEMIPGTNNVFLNTWGSVGIGTTNITDVLTVNGGIMSNGFTAPSDKRLKKNLQTIASPLDKLCNLNGVRFSWKDRHERSEFHELRLPTGNYFGFSAQEMLQIFPELVTERNGLYAVNELGLLPIIVEAIKELRQTIR